MDSEISDATWHVEEMDEDDGGEDVKVELLDDVTMQSSSEEDVSKDSVGSENSHKDSDFDKNFEKVEVKNHRDLDELVIENLEGIESVYGEDDHVLEKTSIHDSYIVNKESDNRENTNEASGGHSSQEDDGLFSESQSGSDDEDFVAIYRNETIESEDGKVHESVEIKESKCDLTFEEKRTSENFDKIMSGTSVQENQSEIDMSMITFDVQSKKCQYSNVEENKRDKNYDKLVSDKFVLEQLTHMTMIASMSSDIDLEEGEAKSPIDEENKSFGECDQLPSRSIINAKIEKEPSLISDIEFKKTENQVTNVKDKNLNEEGDEDFVPETKEDMGVSLSTYDFDNQ